MKKGILIICLFTVSLSVSAQLEKKFITTDRTDVTNVVNLILSNTKNQYKLEGVDTLTCGPCLLYHYSDGLHTLVISFIKLKSGGNSDLEIPDTLHYTFAAIQGFYQDVFPFWKKYYQPDAEMVDVAKTGNGKVIMHEDSKGTWVSTFNKGGEIWQLENRFQFDPNKM